VLPGFIDTHGHLANAGVNLGYIDCSLEAGVKSIKDIQAKITKKARTALGGEWIKGFNFDESKLAEKRIPNKLDLDRAAPNHPVFLTMVGTHVYVANSKAFELMAIRADTPDPPVGDLTETRDW